VENEERDYRCDRRARGLVEFEAGEGAAAGGYDGDARRPQGRRSPGWEITGKPGALIPTRFHRVPGAPTRGRPVSRDFLVCTDGGRGIPHRVGPSERGVTSVKKGDHVHSALDEGMPAVPSILSRQTNLCHSDPPAPGARAVMPDAPRGFSIEGKRSTKTWAARNFAIFHVCRRSLGGRIKRFRRGRPRRTMVCYVVLAGVNHRIRAAVNQHCQSSRPGAKMPSSSASWNWPLNVIQGTCGWSAPAWLSRRTHQTTPARHGAGASA